MNPLSISPCLKHEIISEIALICKSHEMARKILGVVMKRLPDGQTGNAELEAAYQEGLSKGRYARAADAFSSDALAKKMNADDPSGNTFLNEATMKYLAREFPLGVQVFLVGDDAVL